MTGIAGTGGNADRQTDAPAAPDAGPKANPGTAPDQSLHGDPQASAAPGPGDIAGTLRLRADPPRVTRLSRKAVAVLAIAGGLGLAAVLILSLQGRERRQAGPSQQVSTTRVQPAEALASLPADYSQVPQIGPPPGPYVIQAGTIIPAALMTGLRSDLPGQVIAQVTRPVHDSVTGRHLLIPQGSRLIGEYDSRIAPGQKRLLLAWTRLILPDGRSIALDRAPAIDAAGFAGLQDRIDNHLGRLFLAAGLATLLNVGLETGRDEEDAIARAIREGAQDTIGRAGEAIVQRQLSVPPTLTVRPGFPVRVMVTRDLVLEPIGDVR